MSNRLTTLKRQPERITSLFSSALFFCITLFSAQMTAQETPEFKQNVPAFEHFIRVDGTMLYDGDEPFRFFSYNVPTLNYIEDNMQFTNPNPYGLPSSFELHDLYKTVNAVGGRVIRSYTIPVLNRNFPKDAITYVEAPGKFNEQAFKKMDEVIALAGHYKVRLVVPLLNNWQWMGGRPNYAEFRGKTKDEFWTDRQLIEDFKRTIYYVLNRTNTLTGIKYKDDPTIMAWETGNELENPPEWGIEIARYIKSLDKKHLLIDGFHAIHLKDTSVWIQQYSLDEPAIDMINTHHYEPSATETIANLKKTVAMIGGKKPVFLGEFGFISTTGIERVMDYVANEPAIPGAFIWSLRRHHPEGGFYHHSEPVGYGLYRAYHWPGFDDGEIYDERNLMTMYREKAFAIQGKPTPAIKPPEAPTLLPFKHTPQFSWQGAMGASGYNIERAHSASGKNPKTSDWKIIAHNIDDIDTPGFALFTDTTATPGETYFYRVRALNQAGISPPSNAVALKVDYLTLVDKARNIAVLDHSENVTVETKDYRSYKEAFTRLHGNKGAMIRYVIPSKAKQIAIYAYERSGNPNLTLDVSADGKDFVTLKAKIDDFASPEKNYDYLIPRRYVADLSAIAANPASRTLATQHNTETTVRLHFKNTADIVRVEMQYRP